MLPVSQALQASKPTQPASLGADASDPAQFAQLFAQELQARPRPAPAVAKGPADASAPAHHVPGHGVGTTAPPGGTATTNSVLASARPRAAPESDVATPVPAHLGRRHGADVTDGASASAPGVPPGAQAATAIAPATGDRKAAGDPGRAPITPRATHLAARVAHPVSGEASGSSAGLASVPVAATGPANPAPAGSVAVAAREVAALASAAGTGTAAPVSTAGAMRSVMGRVRTPSGVASAGATEVSARTAPASADGAPAPASADGALAPASAGRAPAPVTSGHAGHGADPDLAASDSSAGSSGRPASNRASGDSARALMAARPAPGSTVGVGASMGADVASASAHGAAAMATTANVPAANATVAGSASDGTGAIAGASAIAGGAVSTDIGVLAGTTATLAATVKDAKPTAEPDGGGASPAATGASARTGASEAADAKAGSKASADAPAGTDLPSGEAVAPLKAGAGSTADRARGPDADPPRSTITGAQVHAARTGRESAGTTAKATATAAGSPSASAAHSAAIRTTAATPSATDTSTHPGHAPADARSSAGPTAAVAEGIVDPAGSVLAAPQGLDATAADAKPDASGSSAIAVVAAGVGPAADGSAATGVRAVLAARSPRLAASDTGQLYVPMAAPGGATQVNGPTADNSQGVLAITPPVGDERWSAALSQQALLMASRNIGKAELTLNPEHMGPVQVSLELDRDQATAVFSSPHAAVREAIAASLPQLRDMFAAAGLELAGAQVQSQGGQGSGQPANQSPGQGSSEAVARAPALSPAATAVQAVLAPAGRPTRLLDTFA